MAKEKINLPDAFAALQARMSTGRGYTAWILTATDGYLGEIIDRDEHGGYVMRRVSWVADTGRRSVFLTGEIPDAAEIEVYPPEMTVTIPLSLGPVVHAWPYPLPTATK
jgi:hypothetical protein